MSEIARDYLRTGLWELLHDEKRMIEEMQRINEEIRQMHERLTKCQDRLDIIEHDKKALAIAAETLGVDLEGDD